MNSGSLCIVGRTMRYDVDGSRGWNLPVESIRVIGESTNDHGPSLDDYFLCVATDANRWYEASFYALGREDFLNTLGQALGCKLELMLAGSTEFDSNVLWPPHLVGRKMFSYEPVTSKSWLGRFLGFGSNKQSFAKEVLAHLQLTVGSGNVADGEACA